MCLHPRNPTGTLSAVPTLPRPSLPPLRALSFPPLPRTPPLSPPRLSHSFLADRHPYLGHPAAGHPLSGAPPARSHRHPAPGKALPLAESRERAAAADRSRRQGGERGVRGLLAVQHREGDAVVEAGPHQAPRCDATPGGAGVSPSEWQGAEVGKGGVGWKTGVGRAAGDRSTVAPPDAVSKT